MFVILVLYFRVIIVFSDTFRKMSCYITQDDRIQVLLTVLENMRMAANFKLGDQLKHHEKESRIEEILTLLGLYEHQMTRSSRLSGGQRKRLSIALELINNPTVMFLDEPTTGLDTHSCNQVVNLLRHLASQGRTIICTIHQPSAKLFQEFEQVYVVAAGECLYQGSTQNIVPYLSSIDLPCPMYHNPADYSELNVVFSYFIILIIFIVFNLLDFMYKKLLYLQNCGLKVL